MAERTVRVAFEGCGHGTLHAIYASVQKTCEVNGWPGVDLLIIGGDFQAVRNAYDLNATVIPPKYRDMADFHEYYSGKREAPFLTLFIGGNHEASNHLFELYYGGWVAPKIYYLGAANVLRFGPLRIAGLSGIWKGYNYSKPHYERPPLNQDELRSVYHVREYDVRKLLQVSTQIDIGLSHDWPRGVEWAGDWKKLFRIKKHLEADAREGVLGNFAAKMILDRLRPRYWFSAHYHCKYSAIIKHEAQYADLKETAGQREQATVEISANPDEIDIDLSGDEENTSATRQPEAVLTKNGPESAEPTTAVSDALRQKLPASFQKKEKVVPAQEAPMPKEISNQRTRFLALDKCLPQRHFLQIMEITTSGDHNAGQPFVLMYDKEWLAITRVFAEYLEVGDKAGPVPADKGYEHYQSRILEESEWIEENLVKQDRMIVPENFEITAPIYDPSVVLQPHEQGREYPNPQTCTYCKLLHISNPFEISETEVLERHQRGPKETKGGDGAQRRGFSGRSGRGGRGRGRGLESGRGRGHRWG